jgi:hypothetical protein
MPEDVKSDMAHAGCEAGVAHWTHLVRGSKGAAMLVQEYVLLSGFRAAELIEEVNAFV